jgi:hypothetical protein
MQQKMLSQRQQAQIVELNHKEQVEMKLALEQNKFPSDSIPDTFNEWLLKALAHEKQSTAQCDWKVLRLLHTNSLENSTDYPLQHFGHACNSIEDKTPVQLGVSNEEYVIIQDTIQDLAREWTKIAAELNDPIKKRYKILTDQVRNNKPIIMP